MSGNKQRSTSGARAGNSAPSSPSPHYAFLLYPASALGDDQLWEKLRGLVADDFSERDGEMLAARWQACLEYDSTERLPECRVPLHVIGFSEDVKTRRNERGRSPNWPPTGHFTGWPDLVTGPPSGTAPTSSTTRSTPSWRIIPERELQRATRPGLIAPLLAVEVGVHRWNVETVLGQHAAGQRGDAGRAGAGTWPAVGQRVPLGAMANSNHDDSIRIIGRALDAGINLIDTADVYSLGESEEIVGRAVKGRRGRRRGRGEVLQPDG